MREAVDAEEPVTVELTNYRKDGTTFHNEVTIAPIRDADGTVTHFVGFQNDITDRRTAYDRLERERDRLEEFASVLSRPSESANRGDGVRRTRPRRLFESVSRRYRGGSRTDRAADRRNARPGACRGVVGSLEPVSLSELAVDSWQTVDSGDGSLEVVDDEQFLADPGRSRQLFENLFRNSLEHGVDSDGQGTVRRSPSPSARLATGSSSGRRPRNRACRARSRVRTWVHDERGGHRAGIADRRGDRHRPRVDCRRTRGRRWRRAVRDYRVDRP